MSRRPGISVPAVNVRTQPFPRQTGRRELEVTNGKVAQRFVRLVDFCARSIKGSASAPGVSLEPLVTFLIAH